MLRKVVRQPSYQGCESFRDIGRFHFHGCLQITTTTTTKSLSLYKFQRLAYLLLAFLSVRVHGSLSEMNAKEAQEQRLTDVKHTVPVRPLPPEVDINKHPPLRHRDTHWACALVQLAFINCTNFQRAAPADPSRSPGCHGATGPTSDTPTWWTEEVHWTEAKFTSVSSGVWRRRRREKLCSAERSSWRWQTASRGRGSPHWIPTSVLPVKFRFTAAPSLSQRLRSSSASFSLSVPGLCTILQVHSAI